MNYTCPYQLGTRLEGYKAVGHSDLIRGKLIAFDQMDNSGLLLLEGIGPNAFPMRDDHYAPISMIYLHNIAQYIGKDVHWVWFSNNPFKVLSSSTYDDTPATLRDLAKDGMACKRCKEFYWYAQSNQDDGSLICFACRSNPYR